MARSPIRSYLTSAEVAGHLRRCRCSPGIGRARASGIVGAIAGIVPAVIIFDAEAVLADLDSPEAAVLDGSILVTFRPREVLDDLSGAFVTVN